MLILVHLLFLLFASPSWHVPFLHCHQEDSTRRERTIHKSSHCIPLLCTAWDLPGLSTHFFPHKHQSCNDAGWRARNLWWGCQMQCGSAIYILNIRLCCMQCFIVLVHRYRIQGSFTISSYCITTTWAGSDIQNSQIYLPFPTRSAVQ